MDEAERRKRRADQARARYVPRSLLSPEELAEKRRKAAEGVARKLASLTPDDFEHARARDRERKSRWEAEHSAQVSEKRARYRAENADRLREDGRSRARRRYWSDPEAARERQRAAWSPEKSAAQVSRWRADPRIMFCTQANRKARALGQGTDLLFPRDLPEAPWTCTYCGSESRSFDHVVPFARGGRNVPANVVPCCRPCNTAKGTQLVDEWRHGGTDEG